MVRKVTAQDVADLAGVSRSSVSLVLNGRGAGNIAHAKQEAIVEAALRLHYRPNAVARSLRSQRSMTLGVLTWPGPAGPNMTLLRGVLEMATQAGYLLFYLNTAEARDIEAEAIATLHDRQVDGFLVVAPELVEYWPAELLGSHPTVLLNCVDPQGGLTSLIPDEKGAGARAARLVADLGHERVAVIGARSGTLQDSRRMAGIVGELTSAGADASVHQVERSIAAGYAATYGLLVSDDPPTAVIAAHERPAVGALLAAARLGLTVPDELSVVGLEDDEHLAADLVPGLTTVERPDRAMAEQAVRLMVKQLAAADGPVQQLSYVCPVAPRGSLGGVP